MPTVSAISFENLLESRVRVSPKKPLNVKEVAEPPAAAPRHIYISPALYTTPETTPIPDHLLEPPSPSPYVVNFKRRGSGAGNRKEESGADAVEELSEEENFNFDNFLADAVEEVTEVANFGDGNLLEGAENRDVDKDAGEFIDSKCESASVGSTNEARQFDCRSFLSSQGEFFDAIEDFYSDNSAPSTPVYGRGVEPELHAARLSHLDEMKKCRKAEEALGLMQNRWQRLSNLLAEVGLTFPSVSDAGCITPFEDSLEELCQQIVVTRSVAEAMANALGRAEAETTSDLILESKDQEVSRLRNRLKYYEAMTHEMSQRNLETVGVAREQRQRKNTLKRWIWSCLGLSVAVGISVLGYPYLPDISKHIGYFHSSDGSPEISPSEAV